MCFDLFSQTMMSSRANPRTLPASWGRTERRINPSIHDVRCRPAGDARQGGNLHVPDRAGAFGMVEPDGFEPTTSCLQSTRSTN